jgi:hypothetical protein
MRLSKDLERRKTSRRALDHRVHAKLRFEGKEILVEVMDVSREGMKLGAPDAEIAVGTGVVVSLLGADITAVVLWVDAGEIGLQLLEELDRNTRIALDQTQKKLEKTRQGASS